MMLATLDMLAVAVSKLGGELRVTRDEFRSLVDRGRPMLTEMIDKNTDDFILRLSFEAPAGQPMH